MNKNERKKSQNSVRLFKIEAHLKYLQGVGRSYLCSSIFNGIFQRGIDSECYW